MSPAPASSFETRRFASLLRTRVRHADTNRRPHPEEPAKQASRRIVYRLALALAVVTATPAHAGPVVDRIRAEGVIRCGGASRPGLVGQSPDGREASGLYLDLCRAIGAALLGPEGRIEFRAYDSDRAFERVRDAADDLSFLDGAEILDQHLAGRTTLWPAGRFRLDRGDGPRRLGREKPRRSGGEIGLLLPGLERAPESRGLDGGPSPRLPAHGLHGIRRALRRL